MSMQAPRDLREWQQQVERNLKAAKGGTRIAIEHGTKAAQDVRDEVDSYKDLTPAAPIEITNQTSLYIDANRRQRGTATFDFPDVVFATNGTPISVDRYEIWGQDQGINPLLPFRLMNSSSLSSIYATDLKPGSAWKFRIRARSNDIIKAGLFSADQSVTITADTTPPPQTSAPVATAVSGGVKLEWDGLAAGGATMPGDFDHVDVAFGMTSSPTTIVDTFPGKSFTIIPKTGYNTVHYFRIRAVDTSGNVGPWSVQATAIPVPLVDVDVILSVIDGAKITLGTVASAALADQAVTTAKLAANAVDQTKLANQAVSLAKMATDANDKIQKGIDDAFAADTKAANAQTALDAAKLAYDAKIAQIIAQGISLVRNGDFEAANLGDGWGSGAFNAVESTTARSGTKSMRIGPNPGGNVWPISEYVPAATGRTYYLEGWFKRTGTEVRTQGVGFVVQAKTAAGGTSTPIVGKVDSATISETVWTKVSTTYTVTTADTVAVRFAPWIVAGNNVYNVDDMLVVDVTEANAALAIANQAQTDASKAITDSATALTSANGKNTFTDSTVDAALAIPGKTIGDGWRKWTTLSAGGKLLKSWRWNGSAWIADAMDATYLPLVDIGAGTFGTLNGGRLESYSVLAQHLLVGDFSNMIPGAQLQGGTTGWTTSNATIAAVTAASGLPGLKVTSTSATFEADAYAQFVDCTPGDKVRLSYTTEGVWSSGNAAIYAQKRTADGTITSFNPGNSATNVPGDKSFVLTIPSDAVQVRFRPYISAAASIGSYAIFSNMWARRMNAGELTVDGSVTANAIATNAVQAKHILIGDFQNFALGSDFEDAAAVPWALNTNHTLSTTQKKSGTTSLRLGAATGVQNSNLTADLKVVPGEQYNFKMHAYIDASYNGTSSAGKLRIGDQANTYLGAIPYYNITRSAWTTTPLETVVTIPAGVTKLTIQLQSDHTAGLAYIDDIQIRRMAEASLIQNLGVEKLVATNASMAQAVIDKLWTDVVNSRKITTDMLVVTAGTNMIPDPTFTQPDSRAKKTANNATGWDTYVSSGGIQAIRYGNATPSWPSVGYLNLFDYDSTPGVADKTGWLPVLAGEKYEFSGRLYATDASINTKMYVTFLMADGTTSGWSSPLANPNIAPDGGPNRLPVWEFTIPVNAIKMGARLEHRGTAGWVSLYGDSVYLRKKVDATLIATGGVIADHLTVTDEMWTKILHFKKLTGDEIDANSLTADTGWIGVLRGGILINDAVTTSILKADAITSKHTITGAKIQTTTTANRGLKLTSTGMQMWDTGGKLTMDLNASTGYATMTGRVRTAPDGLPGVVLLPSAESDDGVTMATWYAPDTSSIPGLITAGVFMANPANVTTPTQLHIRGHQYGGVKLWDAVEFISSNGATVPQFFSNSNVGMQATAYNGTFYLTSGAAEVRIKSVFNTVLNVGSGKYINLQQNSAPYASTLGGSANLIMASDGNLFKVASAAKYKIDPVPMALDDRILDDVTVKHWIDLGMAERFAEQYAYEGERTEEEQWAFDALSLERIPGAIAEDVQAAGGEPFVVRGLDNEIESLMYDRLALARTEILKRRVAEQAGEIAELRAIVDGLVASLTG